MITEYGAVMWADPGGMTGLAQLARGRFSADEYEFDEAGRRVWAFCSQWRHMGAVGWERFDVNADTHKKTRQPEAMQVIGVIRWIAAQWNTQILVPASQHTPGTYDRLRLEALGWWTPGKNDAQSAACHLLNWCLGSGQLPSEAAVRLAAARQGR